jgi:hypothetical protein
MRAARVQVLILMGILTRIPITDRQLSSALAGDMAAGTTGDAGSPITVSGERRGSAGLRHRASSTTVKIALDITSGLSGGRVVADGLELLR